MRINEETTGCQFISLATLFRVSLLRLPRSTTTCTRYIYTRTQLATSVKGKREKEAIMSAAFGQQAGKLYEVLSATSSFHFTGRRLLLREFKRRERPIRNVGSLSTIFLSSFRFLFMLFLMSIILSTYHSSVPAKICEIIVQLYLLSFSILVFSSFFWPE